ncbi:MULTISPECIES: MFS transporter [unclassified Streptomyces]|uniref:MFS transporter n=1 Tax=unclassified Streptomyces TaxID=2593676 RepID=UPI00278BBDDF|nr:MULTISPECIES: MFS transporter [unclassified Streptomyces]
MLGTGASGDGTRGSTRVVGLLLAAVAALYVVAPAVHSAAVPLVHAELGLGTGHEVVARVVGSSLALCTLVVAGRAGDLRGRRSVLIVSLAGLAAGCALLAVAFDGWSYVLGRIVVAVALAAVFVSCLAFLPTVFLPGRLRKVIGGWLAAMSVGFVIAVNLAPRAASPTGWRIAMAAMTVAAIAALLLVHRYVPEPAATTRQPFPNRPRACCLIAFGVLAPAALQLAPVWGWSDIRVGLLLLTATAALVVARLRCPVLAPASRARPAQMPGAVRAGTLVAGLALGFTQVVLAMALPSLAAEKGGSPESAALVLSGFGLGGAASCLLVLRRAIAPVTGSTLGLPLAALGLVLLHSGLGNHAYPVAGDLAVVALIGFGIMLAAAPQMARYLAVIPRTHLGVNAALLPGSILLGTAAAQAMPYTSAIDSAPVPAEARQLLRIGTVVLAVAALLLGRVAVSVAVACAAGLQYLLARTGIGDSGTVIVALAFGAAAGAVVWSRREQADRLARISRTASTLQHAVLHPIPKDLGRLRLASLYRPATVDTGIGGDFIEALHTPYGTRILIGDVRGKGLQAVQTVTDLLGCFRSQAYETEELGELAARLDRQVLRVAAARGDEELFATALLLQHDGPDHELRVVNCGHLTPLEVTPRGVTELDVPTLLPLGFGTLGAPGAPLTPHTVRLGADSTLVAHTDGLSEARNSTGEFYPLTDRLTGTPYGTPDHLVGHLDDGVRDWTHHLADDIAIIALRPAEAPVAAAELHAQRDGKVLDGCG